MSGHQFRRLAVTLRSENLEQAQMLADVPPHAVTVGEAVIGEQAPDRGHAPERFDEERIAGTADDLLMEITAGMIDFADGHLIELAFQEALLALAQPCDDVLRQRVPGLCDYRR